MKTLSKIIAVGVILAALSGCGGGSTTAYAPRGELEQGMAYTELTGGTPADEVQIAADDDAALARLVYLYPDFHSNSYYYKHELQQSEIDSKEEADVVVAYFYSLCPKCKEV